MSMTIALIADIHGNLAALDAVLDALREEPPPFCENLQSA